jgi:hypothetical protein
MSMNDPGERLPPFPDALLFPSRLDDVVQFLREQDMPARLRRSWLAKWASYTGTPVDAVYFQRVAGGPAGFEG